MSIIRKTISLTSKGFSQGGVCKIRAIDFFYRLFYYLILARVILSFIALNPYDTKSFLGQARQVVYKITEPVLAPLRKVIPPVRAGAGYLDLSPIVALIGLLLVRNLLIQLWASFM